MTPIQRALRQTGQSVRLLNLIYAVTLLLGLLSALPFYSTFQAESQHSRAFLNLLNGFDYTVFTDFWQQSGHAIQPLLSVGRWTGLLYLFLSLFFAGGILRRFSQPSGPFFVGQFWQGCTQYVGRFARLFGVTLLFVIVGGSIWLLLGTLLAVLLADLTTERGQFWIGAGFFGLFGLTVTLVLCIGDYAKVLLFREDSPGAFRAFGQAGRLVLQYPLRTYGTYLLFMLIGTGFFGLYFLFDSGITAHNWPTIVLLFLVQQVLIYGRVGLKVWALGTAYHIYGAVAERSVPVIDAVMQALRPVIPPETDSSVPPATA